MKVVVTNNGQKSFRLDNMADRKMTGTSDVLTPPGAWLGTETNDQGEFIPCEIVSNVPENATQISFGFLLCGGYPRQLSPVAL